MAGGEVLADVDVDDRVILGGQRGEDLGVIGDVDGGCGGQVASGGHVVENLLGDDVHAVPMHHPVQIHIEGHNGDLVFLQQGLGQIAGAVSGDFNRHRESSIVISMVLGIPLYSIINPG